MSLRKRAYEALAEHKRAERQADLQRQEERKRLEQEALDRLEATLTEQINTLQPGFIADCTRRELVTLHNGILMYLVEYRLDHDRLVFQIRQLLPQAAPSYYVGVLVSDDETLVGQTYHDHLPNLVQLGYLLEEARLKELKGGDA